MVTAAFELVTLSFGPIISALAILIIAVKASAEPDEISAVVETLIRHHDAESSAVFESVPELSRDSRPVERETKNGHWFELDEEPEFAAP